MRENYGIMDDWIGLSEGGYVNNPKDPGGATNRGITQATFDWWRRMRGEPIADVRNISRAEASAIIEFQYFDKVAADRLPSGLDYAVADYAVNSGPAKAAKDLQRILGVTADGVIGAQTLAAVHAFDPAELAFKLCKKRWAFMQSLRHFDTFKNGWFVRVWGEKEGVQDGDIGVADRAVRMAHRIPSNVIPMPKPSQGKASGKSNPFKAFWASLRAA